MNSQFLSRFSLVSLFTLIILILILRFPLSLSDPDEFLYQSCGTTFNCGSMTGIGYPFRGYGVSEYCGYPGLVLNCQNNVPTIDMENITYRVLDVDQAAQTMKIVREDVIESNCPHALVNTTLDSSLFDFPSPYTNLSFLYGCRAPLNSIPIMNINPVTSCNVSGYSSVYLTPVPPGLLGCDISVVVPVAGLVGPVNSTELERAVRGGFEVEWKVDSSACGGCTGSNGRCGYSLFTNQTTCYCPDPPYVGNICSSGAGAPTASMPTPGSNSSHKAKGTSTGLYAAGAVIAGVGLGWVIFAFVQRRKHRAAKSVDAETKDLSFSAISKGLTTTASTSFSRSIRSFPSSNTEFGKASTYFGIQVFNYIELEEATDNFNPARELGNGGFGTVYYGQLQDGRIVAVKRLYENNFKRVEQFMNEVEILTRLRHDNLVILYGCTSRRSRELLLVYEYVPNGTVADHLHGRRVNSGLLSWPIRLSIAVETADALAYLHKSDIVHRDVKTNNILLDKTFRVKVADFGLSRLFPTDVTHVSTAPQGTPGYVDPEYYQCYQLTEKSDVYSFGVVLIELISSKQAVDTNRDRHDINLSNMAISKIQNHALRELVDPSLGFETNSSTRRMITLVAELAFRCLQMEKDMRPSMEEVLEVLRGIQNEELNAQKPEVLDIVVEDEVGLLKGNSSPKSTDSVGA